MGFLNQSLFNNILSVIGVLTGLAGLCVSLYVLSKERIKLEVFHPTNDDASSYIGFSGIYEGQNEIGDKCVKYTGYLLFIWLRIVNQSKHPTTILELSVKIPKYEESILYSRTSDIYSVALKYKEDEVGNIDVKSSLYYDHALKLPITVAHFSTIEGYFYFRDFKEIKNKTIHAVLKIKTPQGITKHKITLAPNYPTLID